MTETETEKTARQELFIAHITSDTSYKQHIDTDLIMIFDCTVVVGNILTKPMEGMKVSDFCSGLLNFSALVASWIQNKSIPRFQCKVLQD